MAEEFLRRLWNVLPIKDAGGSHARYTSSSLVLSYPSPDFTTNLQKAEGSPQDAGLVSAESLRHQRWRVLKNQLQLLCRPALSLRHVGQRYMKDRELKAKMMPDTPEPQLRTF